MERLEAHGEGPDEEAAEKLRVMFREASTAEVLDNDLLKDLSSRLILRYLVMDDSAHNVTKMIQELGKIQGWYTEQRAAPPSKPNQDEAGETFEEWMKEAAKKVVAQEAEKRVDQESFS